MDFHLNTNSEKPNNSVKLHYYKLVKLQKTKVNLRFNKTCNRLKLIPKYINVKVVNKSVAARTAKQKAEQNWLKNSIKQLYTRINQLTVEVYNLQLNISKNYHKLQYEAIMASNDSKMQRIIKKKCKIVKNKLNKLKVNKVINSSNKTIDIQHNTLKFNQKIENQTDINFNNNEIKLMEKGLKHCIHPPTNNSEQNKHLLNIENAILKTNPMDQQEIRAVIISELSKKQQNGKTTNNKTNNKKDIRTINNIKRKIKQRNAVITKADKGNTIVIMYTEDYNNKIRDYINKNQIEKLQADPTKDFNTKIKQVISKSNNILSDRSIRFNKTIKPTAPKIRGLPKIHKEGTPIRPLVNFTTSPTYRIAKHINRLLKYYIKLNNSNSLTNNIDLVNKIKTIEIPHNARLASFDITNMYTNIPVEETIDITRKLLINNGLKTIDTNEIINLITEITKQNYFTHNKEFYKQTIGLPMGSPLSGTLAEIYLNDFENKHVHHKNNKQKDNIIYWYRYVDDILILFKGTLRQLDKLHQYINNREPTIKFTLETETNNTINFLDLTIKNIDSKHSFKIYRKPTQTDQTIHNKSHHPHQHKIAAYNHMIHRLNNIPMSKNDYKDELNIIKHIAITNGYPPTTIDRINNKQVTKINQQNLTTLQTENNNKDKKYISVEYNKTTHKTIEKTLKKFGYTTAYKNTNKLEQRLNDTKTEIDTGVYKLTCDDCTKFYIGQTGRSFSVRFKEHISDIAKKEPKSNYAQHIQTENHKYTDFNKNLTILHKIRKGQKLDRLEEIEIYKNRNNSNLINEKINTKTNKLYDLILKNKQ